NQLDRGAQLGPAKILVDAHFIAFEMGEVHLDRELRSRRRPNGRAARSALFLPAALFHRRHVDFQLRPDANLRFGIIVRGQRLLVELLGDERRPGMMKAFPAARAVQRWMEMVEQRHWYPLRPFKGLPNYFATCQRASLYRTPHHVVVNPAHDLELIPP